MFRVLYWRALRLRCPRCGAGKLYKHGYTMHESCEACGWVFEREEGYWTGAMAVNLVVAEALIFATIFPLLISQAPLALTLTLGMGLAVLAPLLFYRHSKAFWMAMDFMMHPVELVTPSHIMTVEELRQLVSRITPDATQPLDVDQQQRDIGGGHTGDA